MNIFRYAAVTLLLAASGPGHAVILKYEMTFVASNPGHSTSGKGYLLADTEKDAVIGGRLESEQLAFDWLNPDAGPLAFEERYHTADLVHASGAGFINEITGEKGSIGRLTFLIVGPEGRTPYAAHLDDNWAGEFWTDIWLPSYSTDELFTDMYIGAPTVVETATHAVPEPTTLSLLALGLTAIGIRRRLR